MSEKIARAAAAAGALFLDGDGRVMLVQPTYKSFWDLPGGYLLPGETPTEACAREVREELGLDLVPGRLLVVDWAPHPAEGDKILFVFEGGRLTGEQHRAIRLPPAELSAYRYVSAEELPEFTVPRLARRILRALSASSTVYLENGA